MNNLKNDRIFFQNLDSLRFFAFFFVFISHAVDHFGFPQSSLFGKIAHVLITLNGQAGPLGVQFFFVLSGFLITYLLFSEKENNTQKFNLLKFYFRRLLRIWPLYFLAVLFGFWIYPLIFNWDVEEKAKLLNHLLFLGNLDLLWNGIPVGVPLSVLWSVSVEEQFYLFWPLIFLFVKKQRSYLVVFFILLIISIVFQLYHYNDRWINYFHSISCMGSLVIGGILAYFCFYHALFLNTLKNLPKWLLILVYILGIALIYFTFYIPGVYSFVIIKFLVSVFFGFIIIEQNFSEKSFLKFGKFNITSYWGKLTYGLYILHPVSIWLVNLFHPVHEATFFLFIFKTIVALIISMLLAYISFYYFEVYFLKLKARHAEVPR